MKTGSLVLATLGMLAAASPASAERFTSWYGAIEGGGNWIEQFELQEYLTPLAGPPSDATMRTEPGWAALVTVGYAFPEDWRLEVEAGYRYNGLDTIQPSGGLPAPIDGHFRNFTVMANAVHDIVSPQGVVLSVGGGVGAVHSRLDSTGLATDFDGDDVSLAFQGIAGLSVPMADWLDMSLNYRFLYVRAMNLVDENTAAPALSTVSLEDFKSHTLTLGFRFGSRPGEVPMMQAEAPPPPPPPQVPRQYIVFFGFNKCNITASADNVLSEAANAARQLGTVSVRISGHTDTVGSVASNQKLSECRANAARLNLVAKGVPDNAIRATGYGEGQLLIQTGDGVKEPQNRRVNVDLD
jgi:outer membrane protein OmpA-like peptidoglycan-associated protein